MRKIVLSFLVTLFLLLVSTSLSFARSGCCSHHGGVCGCGCCDGSSLSAVCAPYYPECNNSNTTTDTSQQMRTSIPTIAPTTKPTATPTISSTPTRTPTPKVQKKAVKAAMTSNSKPFNLWTAFISFLHL